MGQNAGPDGRDAGRPLQIRSLCSDLIFSDSVVSSSSEDGRTVKPDYRLEKTLPHRPALHPSRPSDASQLLPMVSPSLKASIVPICGLPALETDVGVSAVPATRCWRNHGRWSGEATFGAGGHFINGCGRY